MNGRGVAQHNQPPTVELEPGDPRIAEPDFDEWRRGGITGTDAPKVLGVSRYGDALDVYISKVNLAPTRIVAGTGFQQRGRALEDVAAREFQSDLGVRVTRVARRAHPARPWQRAHLDRRVLGTMVHPTAGLELKTTTRSRMETIKSEGCPEEFAAQLAHECDVWDYSLGYLFVLCPETWERRVFVYDWTQCATLMDLRALEEALWTKHIVPRVPPMEWATVAKPVVTKGAATDEGDIFALTGDVGEQFIARMFELKEARALAEEAKLMQELARAEIETFMSGNGFSAVEIDAMADGVLRRLRYYYRETAARRTLDQAKLLKFVKAHHPDVNVDAEFYKTGEPGIYSRDFWIQPKAEA
jgi:predicted phage-related endonuclease